MSAIMAPEGLHNMFIDKNSLKNFWREAGKLGFDLKKDHSSPSIRAQSELFQKYFKIFLKYSLRLYQILNLTHRALPHDILMLSDRLSFVFSLKLAPCEHFICRHSQKLQCTPLKHSRVGLNIEHSN